MERRVDLNGEGFRWTDIPLDQSEPGLRKELELYLQLEVPDPAAREVLTRSLPDDYVVELCPAARAWWRSAAERLGVGKLMTIDYGLAQQELLAPQRTQGTLRAFRDHHAISELLSDPGKQDLTAHVNFAALIKTGETCGLATETFTTQERFLVELVANLGVPMEQWSSQQKRQFLTLMHPQQLGNTFRVLVQSRT